MRTAFFVNSQPSHCNSFRAFDGVKILLCENCAHVKFLSPKTQDFESPEKNESMSEMSVLALGSLIQLSASKPLCLETLAFQDSRQEATAT